VPSAGVTTHDEGPVHLLGGRGVGLCVQSLEDNSVFESMIDMILCAIAELKGRQSAQTL